MCSLKYMTSLLAFLICLTSAQRENLGDSSKDTFLPYYTDQWRSVEDKAFSESGICGAENRSHVELCNFWKTLIDLFDLKRTQCFCDEDCNKYDDCCLNLVSELKGDASAWKCREVGEGNVSKNPIYVFQQCPEDWTDPYTKLLCEIEAVELERIKVTFSHLQDMPVKSKTNGIFYRNIYCAMCNRQTDLVKWNSILHCSGNYLASYGEIPEDKFDFSNSTYHAKTRKFQNVIVEGRKTNCRIVVYDFQLENLTTVHKARLCKPVINTCSRYYEELSLEKCNSYTSFVYESRCRLNDRRIYKNFHCALCNDVNIRLLSCVDPCYPTVLTGPVPSTGATLSFLFDFNFEGDNNQLGVISPCKLTEGLIWDSVLKKCSEFTCGLLFERKGLKCLPRVTEKKIVGLNNSCPKRIYSKNGFIIYRNRSVFLKESAKILTPDEYEINEKDDYDVISINVCVEEGSYLLHLSKFQNWLSEITLSFSIICLILHLIVYSSIKELRNCPGKILMSLSVCIICGHMSLLIGQYIASIYWMCYVCGVLTHFGYLSSFLWMNVMAYDIYRTFSITQSRNLNNKKTFLKYSGYSWIVSVAVTTISVTFDNLIHEDNEFRPKYGDPICWFNQRKGLLVFFILPVFILLVKNVVFFSFTAFRIRKISKETKMVKNFSDKIRYLLYIKLTVVFGLTWLLGILAGILRIPFLWYPFIIFNGLQGVFIFAAFTLKRKIIRILRVKLRINSDSYKLGKQSAIKRAIYSSLSNLSTLQTTLNTQLPILERNQEILKAVKRLNPD